MLSSEKSGSVKDLGLDAPKLDAYKCDPKNLNSMAINIDLILLETKLVKILSTQKDPLLLVLESSHKQDNQHT